MRTQVALTATSARAGSARLVRHLDLFLRVAVLGEHVNLRDGVEGDLALLGAGGFVAPVECGARLVGEPDDGGTARTGDRLVGADNDALERRDAMDGSEGQDHGRRRAVGLADDALVPFEVFGLISG